jgi:hypothetical protein
VCGIAAWPYAGGCERVFVPGVLEEGIASGGKADNGKEKIEKGKWKPKSKKTWRIAETDQRRKIAKRD